MYCTKGWNTLSLSNELNALLCVAVAWRLWPRRTVLGPLEASMLLNYGPLSLRERVRVREDPL